MNSLQSHDAFESRGHSFEERYYHTKDAELVDKLKQVFQSKMDKDDLRKASGITNEEVLDRLVTLSVKGQLLTAFKLYPLVEIAWADGKVDKREAEAVMLSAIKFGVPHGSEALSRLEDWLHRGPTEDGRAAWRMFAGELRKTLDAAQLATFRQDLLKYANDVAHASGGILGIYFTISEREKMVLDAITRQLTQEQSAGT